jgi:hypothetical protein
VATHLSQLEVLRGTLPMSVQAWYETVGSVNFIGSAPATWWDLRLDLRDRPVFLDSICLRPAEQAVRTAEYNEAEVLGEFDNPPWVLQPSDEDPSGWTVSPIRLSDIRGYIVVGPDICGKHDYSGSDIAAPI